MEERCALCRYCCELYTPPTAESKAKYEYCCTLFLREKSVMVLGDDVYGPCARCECFDSAAGEMINLKCPKCGSEDFDCFDMDSTLDGNTKWDICSCDECGALFEIKYVAVAIEQIKESTI